MAANRVEKDSMGPIDVPADKLWGAQTQRSPGAFPYLNREDAGGAGARAGDDQTRGRQR